MVSVAGVGQAKFDRCCVIVAAINYAETRTQLPDWQEHYVVLEKTVDKFTWENNRRCTES